MMRMGARLDGDQFESAVRDPSGRQQAFGNAPQLVAAPTQDDHLETTVFVEMNVKRRAHVLSETMLELRQSLGELTHVMVVDQGQRPDGGHAALDLRARDFRAHEIAQDFGARDPSRLRDGIEIAE